MKMFRKIGSALRRFMYGRYGSDQLNLAILIVAAAVSLTNSILTVLLQQSVVYRSYIAPGLSVLVYGLVIYAVFRLLSRNIYQRQRENKWFSQLWTRLRDRSHRYYRCPACKQLVRVPKGRGKICIRWAKWGEKFVRKT